MRHIYGICGGCGRLALAGIAAVLACVSLSHGAWSGMHSCYGPPRVVSPLDMPLTPYVMPRRPAWGGSQFCYHIKPTPQCQLCGCGRSDDDATVESPTPYPPELAECFEPAQLEHLGRIPHEPLLGAGPAVGPVGH